MRSVSDIMQHGGTALYTARSPEFNTPAGVEKAANMCREKGIEGVVVIGGDGSFRGARDLTNAGITLHRCARHHRQRHCLHRLHHRL